LKCAQGPLEEFLSLGTTRKRQLLRTILLLVAIRLGLWTIRFRLLRRFVEKRSSQRPLKLRNAAENAAIIAIIARNVAACARMIPAASCLTRALAAQILLRNEGLVGTLRIGVARAPGLGFKAHAWLECDGWVVVGGDEMGNYAPLPPIVNC
jgi:hypothetical protein